MSLLEKLAEQSQPKKEKSRKLRNFGALYLGALGGNIAGLAGNQYSAKKMREGIAAEKKYLKRAGQAKADAFYKSNIAYGKKKNPGLEVALTKDRIDKSIDREVRMARDALKELGVPEDLSRMIGVDLKQRMKSGGPQYSMGTNTVRMNRSGTYGSPSVFKHELGHATGGLGKKILQNPLVRVGMPAAGAVSQVAGAYKGVMAGGKMTAKKREKKLRESRNLMAGGLAASTSPILLEEGRATARALARTKRKHMGRTLKTLLPAYGTYVSKLLPAGLGSVGALEYLRRKAARKINKGK